MIGSGSLGIEVEAVTLSDQGARAPNLMSATRILAATSGRGRLALLGAEYAVTPGSVAVVPPGIQQRWILPSGGLALVQMRLRTRCLSPHQAVDRRALDLLRRLWAWSRRDGPLLDLPVAVRRAVAARLAGLTVAAVAAQDLILKAGVLDLLALFGGAIPERIAEDSPRTGAVPGLRAAIAHLDRTLDRAVAVDELCSIAGLGRSRFDQLFRSATGYSATDYHLRARLARAAELLRTSDRGVLDIGLTCGFGSASRFYDAFSRLHGVSPGRWRRRQGR